MAGSSISRLQSRLAALEARVDALAGTNPVLPRDESEPTATGAPRTLPDVLRRLNDLAGQAAHLAGDAALHTGEDVALADSSDRLLLLAVTDGRGETQAQATTLHAVVSDEADTGLAALAIAAGHPLRVRIMKLLVAGERSAKDIGQAIDLEGGPLYHHLRTLTGAGLVRQPERSRYRLTDAGRRCLLLLGGLHRAIRYAGEAPAAPSGTDHE